MTSKKTPLDALDDAMFLEIMNTPDSEIISEVGEVEIAKGFATLDRAKQKVAQHRLLAAKAALEADRASRRGKVVPIDRGRAKADLDQLLRSDAALRGKLTLAARNAKGDMEDDEGLLDDLAELQRDAERDRDG